MRTRQALSRRIQLRASFATVAGFLLAGCGHSSAIEFSAASPATVVGTRDDAERSLAANPELVARGWLNALRDQDHAVMITLTALPFHFQTTAAIPRCRASAATQAELRTIAECVVADALLLEELKQADELHVSRLPRDQVPSWAAKIVSESSRDRTAVKAFINGDGVTYVFLLLVTGAHVETCVKHAEFVD